MAADGSHLERLGEAKPITDAAKVGEIVDTLNLHRLALLESAGDQQRTRERVDRMGPELREKIAEHRASSSMLWVPGGDPGALDHRYYAGGEIGVRLNKRTVQVPVLNAQGQIEMEGRVEHGLLTDPYTVTPQHERARSAYVSYALARVLATKNAAFGGLVRSSWHAFREAMLDLPGETGKWARSVFNDAGALKRVIDSTAGTGGELIATPTLSTIVRPTDIQRRIVGMVPVIEPGSRTFKKPVVSGRALLQKRGATTNDPARYPVTSFTTSDSTLTLVKTIINVLLDSDWAGEAGIILGDAIGYIRMLIAEGVADSLEMAFLHGDTAASHQDTIASWTMGSRYTAGDLDGTNSLMKLWIGFRAEAFDRSATVAAGGTLDAADHFEALAKMKALGAKARVAVGLYGFYTQFLANSLFTTVDKAGAAATLQTGQLGQIGDTPIDLSDFLTNEYASSGLFTNSGTTNTAVYYAPGSYRFYRHQGENSEWDVTEPHKGAQYVGVKEEGLLDKLVPAAEVPAAAIINL